MPPIDDTAAPASAEHITLYIAIEVSRQSWVARWLDQAMSVETVVLDPASLLVNRKAKQRKTDRIDARKMVCALLAHDRGDAAVLSRVRIPSVEEEDRTRLLRERRRLVKEKTSLTNSIEALFKPHGFFDLDPRAKGLGPKFAEVRTGYGSPFPPRARQEIFRLVERLSLVQRQIAQVEAERNAVVRQSHGFPAPVAAPTRLSTAPPGPTTPTSRLRGRPQAQSEKFSIGTNETFSVGIDSRTSRTSWCKSVGDTADGPTSGVSDVRIVYGRTSRAAFQGAVEANSQPATGALPRCGAPHNRVAVDTE